MFVLIEHWFKTFFIVPSKFYSQSPVGIHRFLVAFLYRDAAGSFVIDSLTLFIYLIRPIVFVPYRHISFGRLY